MSINIEATISFLKSKVGKVSYSMYGSRNFSDGTCDCSGAVYTALRHGGASNAGYILSTETLHAWLIKNGFKLIAENSEWKMKRGDVVIWGRKGASAGAGGHTGICVDSQNWLECTAYRDLGETQQNHDARWAMNGGPYFYVYRYTGPASTTKSSVKPATKKPSVRTVNVTYGLHQIGGGWLGDVKNFNSTDSGYAGNPNHKHDFLFIKVDHGSVRYQVHTIQSGWLGWVTKGDKSDTINGCAGVKGEPIDKVQIEYLTPSGEPYEQAWYRSQTTMRKGWLDTVCDLGKSVGGYPDDFAGEQGEPLDRLQISIGIKNPF